MLRSRARASPLTGFVALAAGCILGCIMAQSFHQQLVRQNPKWSIYGTVCTPLGSPDRQPTDILQQEASREKPMDCITPAPTCNASAQYHLLPCTNSDVQEVKPNAPNTLALLHSNVTFPFCACTQPNRACSRLLTWSSQLRDRKASLSGEKAELRFPGARRAVGFSGPAS